MAFTLDRDVADAVELRPAICYGVVAPDIIEPLETIGASEAVVGQKLDGMVQGDLYGFRRQEKELTGTSCRCTTPSYGWFLPEGS